MLRIFPRKLLSFLHLPLTSQLMIPVIWFLLGLARAMILLLPFRWLSKWLGQPVKTLNYSPLLTTRQIRSAQRYSRLIRAIANTTPWKSNCFPQALVACLLFRATRIPYIMHFGLPRPPHPHLPMEAHAWVTAGTVAVTGGHGNKRKYIVVGSYLPPSFITTANGLHSTTPPLSKYTSIDNALD